MNAPFTAEQERTLAEFGKACGLALSDNKLAEGITPATATDADLVEATVTLLDRLDDATDAFLAAQGTEHRAERIMQADLRRIAAGLRSDKAGNVVWDNEREQWVEAEPDWVIPVRLALEAMAEAYGNGVLHRQAVTALDALNANVGTR